MRTLRGIDQQGAYARVVNKGQPSSELGLSEEERAMIRKAGADAARSSRVAQGLPERIEDPAAIALLAGLLSTARCNGDRKLEW